MVRPGMNEHLTWPGVTSNLYLNSKRKVEPLLFKFAREKGFFVASALPAWMWGPHDVGPTPSGKLVYDALANKLPPMVPPGGSALSMSGMWQSPCFALRRSGALESDISSVVASPNSLSSLRTLPP